MQAPTLIGSTLFQQERTREGGHIDVECRPNDRLELNLDGFYSHLDASNVNDNYMYWGSNELANNLPTSFTVANNTLTSAVWPRSCRSPFTPPPPQALAERRSTVSLSTTSCALAPAPILRTST